MSQYKRIVTVHCQSSLTGMGHFWCHFIISGWKICKPLGGTRSVYSECNLLQVKKDRGFNLSLRALRADWLMKMMMGKMSARCSRRTQSRPSGRTQWMPWRTDRVCMSWRTVFREVAVGRWKLIILLFHCAFSCLTTHRGKTIRLFEHETNGITVDSK